jgi:THO complex subunit 4
MWQYNLTQRHLQDLFAKIAPVVKFNLRYDRAGRSEGVAFVTYETREDAMKAIKEYDGANAYGNVETLVVL